MQVRAYLRASTEDQDAGRVRAALTAFAHRGSLTVGIWYVKTDIGSKLVRPELFRLPSDAHPDNVVLIQ